MKTQDNNKEDLQDPPRKGMVLDAHGDQNGARERNGRSETTPGRESQCNIQTHRRGQRDEGDDDDNDEMEIEGGAPSTIETEGRRRRRDDDETTPGGGSLKHIEGSGKTKSKNKSGFNFIAATQNFRGMTTEGEREEVRVQMQRQGIHLICGQESWCRNDTSQGRWETGELFINCGGEKNSKKHDGVCFFLSKDMSKMFEKSGREVKKYCSRLGYNEATNITPHEVVHNQRTLPRQRAAAANEE